jgi:hypothetical protein
MLDHPHLVRKAEMALMALGGPRPDCLWVFDAVTGRVGSRGILWRRGAYHIARRVELLKICRQPGPRTSLEEPLLERYANYVRHRALLWLDRLLPAGTTFDVEVIPPPELQPRPMRGPWSWRVRPGYSLNRWGMNLTMHVPLDWCVSVEEPLARSMETGFICDARADRRGRMVRRLHCKVLSSSYGNRGEWSLQTEDLDSGEAVPPRRWPRAKRSCRIGLPPVCQS